MISLILVLCIVALLAVVIVTTVKDCWDEGPIAATVLLAIAVIGFGIWDVILGYDVATKPQILEQKIAMYQEENQIIEAKIDALVEDYMKFEKETYGQFKSESLIELVSLFPELKADSLVSEQITVYLANEQQIKSLRQELIEIQGEKWLLYFGS